MGNVYFKFFIEQLKRCLRYEQRIIFVRMKLSFTLQDIPPKAWSSSEPVLVNSFKYLEEDKIIEVFYQLLRDKKLLL